MPSLLWSCCSRGQKSQTRHRKQVRKTLPAQTARRGRAAAEQGHKRSYWIAGWKLSLLLPFLRCCSSSCCRSGACCSCCFRCSSLPCRDCSSRRERASRSMTARFCKMASRRDPSAFGAKTRPPVWASFREASGEPFWSHFGVILESFWRHFGSHFGVILELC